MSHSLVSYLVVIIAILWTAGIEVPAAEKSAGEKPSAPEPQNGKPDKSATAPATAGESDHVPPSAFVVPPGLEVTLWAKTPLLHNPANLDVDPHGRMWVTEGVNYRQHRGRRPEGDRVVVIEDSDGDGQARTG